jgi:ABC-type multidrug transport system fused ATPase/permease subunit
LAIDFISEMPNGLDTILGDRGVTISGGQRQRLAIARAILRDPEVLILDEALSALDGKTEAKVMESLQLTSPHRTIILVSHRLASIVNSDQILVLEGGRVIEQGNHEELKSRGGKYMELFASQIDSNNSV